MTDVLPKVTGAARFAADLVRPRMLHAAILGSPHPHARIRSIDPTAARRMPGVAAVLSGRDLGEPWLAVDAVRCVGAPLVLVAADRPGRAREAASRVRVDYEILEATLDLDAGGPAVASHRIERGDAAAALEAADEIVEATFTTGSGPSPYLEPIACLAEPTPEGGVVVHASCGSVRIVQEAVAAALGVWRARVRILQAPTGGAFGAKDEAAARMAARAALLARATGRPVRLALDREEDARMTCRRPAGRFTVRLGARRDGTLTGLVVEGVVDGGAGPFRPESIAAATAAVAAGPYRIDDVTVDVRLVETHRTPAGTTRGHGGPAAAFALEGAVDRMAGRLELDPVELRRRNLEPEDVSVLERAAGAIGWGREESISSEPGVVRRALGVAVARWEEPVAAGAVGARLEALPDGSVLLAIDHADTGEGRAKVMARLAAAALGVHSDRVIVRPVDTDVVPTADSRTTSSGLARAVREAVQGLKAGRPSATGWGDPGPPRRAFAAHAVAVEVDTTTGVVRVRQVRAGHDVGRVVDELAVRALIEEGIGLGIDLALAGPVGRRGPAAMTRVDVATELLETGGALRPVADTSALPTAAAIAGAVARATDLDVDRLPLPAEAVRAAWRRAPWSEEPEA